MPVMKLTARQIEWIDEINMDSKAAEETLKVALQYYSNTINELTKQRKKFWEELAEIHGLNLYENDYITKRVDGSVQIIDKGPRDEEY
jgi:hypothetical protein